MRLRLSWRDLPPAALLLAVLTICYELTLALICVAALVLGLSAARQDHGL